MRLSRRPNARDNRPSEARGQPQQERLKVTLTIAEVKGNFVDDLIVGQSALRHGVTEADIRHAYRNAVVRWQMEEGLEMHIGPSTSGMLLEIGVVVESGRRRVVHAMTARAKFLPRTK